MTDSAPSPPPPPPHYHGHRQRLRERFLLSGLDGFAAHEKIELLLTLAIPRSDVKKPAKALIEKFKTLRGVMDASLEDLQSVPGVGNVAPVALKIIRAAATEYLRGDGEVAEKQKLSDPQAMRAFWRMRIGGERCEMLAVAYLNTDLTLYSDPRRGLDGVEIISHGDVDRTAVYPRRILEGALRRGVAKIVLAHNHPSGNASPSEADKRITRQIALAAASLDMTIIDHLVVCADDVFSFREAGLL